MRRAEGLDSNAGVTSIFRKGMEILGKKKTKRTGEESVS